MAPTCQGQHSHAPRPRSRSSTATSSPSGCAQRAAHSARTATMAPCVPSSSEPCLTWQPSTQLLQQHGPAQRSCAAGQWDGSSGLWGASRISVAGDSIRSAAPESPLCNLASSGRLRASRMVSGGNFLNSDLAGICCWEGHTSP